MTSKFANPLHGVTCDTRHRYCANDPFWNNLNKFLIGCFQSRKNLLRLVHEIKTDAATVILFMQPPQALVFDSPDHACALPSV